MDSYSPQIARLIKQFRSLPGVGNKSAQKYAFAIAKMSNEEAKKFANSIIDLKENNKRCSCCQNLTDQDICPICSSTHRDKTKILVVEQPQDIVSFECSGAYNGLYHILYGALDPKNKISINELTISELLERAKDDALEEVILATNPTYEGEITANTISQLFNGTGIKVSRIGYGMSIGCEVENTDGGTLSYALNSRTSM